MEFERLNGRFIGGIWNSKKFSELSSAVPDRNIAFIFVICATLSVNYQSNVIPRGSQET